MSTSKENVITILKEKYEYENERKRYYDNIITLPISLLAFIITGLYFIVSDSFESKRMFWFSELKPYIIFIPLVSIYYNKYMLFV